LLETTMRDCSGFQSYRYRARRSLCEQKRCGSFHPERGQARSCCNHRFPGFCVGGQVTVANSHPMRDLLFLSTTKFGRTKEDEDQKPYPVMPHRSSPSSVSFLCRMSASFLRIRAARAEGARSRQMIAAWVGLRRTVFGETSREVKGLLEKAR
jgi:hypothetical protein